MKRVCYIFLTLVLAVALAIPASAAAYMGLSSSGTTVHRGDSFEIYVNLTNDQKIGQGGIRLNYDSSVFTFVGGSCNVSGTILSDVSANRGGGVFLFDKGKEQVVTGTIFTIKMQVKPDAPFGVYTVSGDASMDIACSAGSVSLTVACAHSHSPWASVDGSSHTRSCSVCGEVQTLSHSWDGGTVTKEANCTETGTKLFTCMDCGYRREDAVPANGSHSYGNPQKNDGETHWATCSLCGRTVKLSHSWQAGSVITPATCTQAGQENIACSACGEAGTREIPQQEHAYGAFVSTDDSTHSRSCTACGLVESLPHRDTGSYASDVKQHYGLCPDCGYRREAQAHVPGPAPTKTEPQTCTVCGFVLRPALNHVHSYGDAFSSDEACHWYACESCPEKGSLAIHSFESDCSDTCTVCGYARTAPHDYSDLIASDASGHWYPCRICGEKKAFSAHISGGAATLVSGEVCTLCGYEIAPKLTHTCSFDDALHLHICSCGALSPAAGKEDCALCYEAPFPWWAVCGAEGVVILALGALLAWKLLKKPREEEETAGEETAEEETSEEETVS